MQETTSAARPIRRIPEHGDDEGVALVVAIALVGIVSVMMLTMMTFSMRESRSSGRDRQRSSAVTTAEGAVDQTLAAIQNAPVANLPCESQPVVTSSTAAAPDTMTISTSVAYYDSAGGKINDCTALRSGSISATRALVTSTSTSNSLAGAAPAVRSVSTLVSMRATMSNTASLNRAIFGDLGVSASNNLTLNGSGGAANADIYSNKNFVCDNSTSFAGSVYAQGSITLHSSCTVQGTAWAKSGYLSDGQAAGTSGDVYVSQGAVAVTKGHINGSIKALSVTPSSICVPGKCTLGAGVVANPKPATFPVLDDSAATQAAWTAAGFTVRNMTNCTSTDPELNPSRWLAEKASTATTKTLILTNCQISFNPSDNKIALGADVAVFARGGFSLSQSLTFESNGSDPRTLYLVQPYNSVVMPCNTTGINLGNRVTFDATVSTLLYTPCNLEKNNNSSLRGQVYAGGTATFAQATTMDFLLLPVWGVTSAVPDTVASYSADVLYKREDQS